ncbi:hypothetical protein O6H91_Y429800 [Diphasiastrum complanatum]|nr:hypothetical protein O6H91_Y429800 [Diphasiastrum complanatum]
MEVHAGLQKQRGNHDLAGNSSSREGIGMLMDLISPLFPRAFLTLLCIGSAARSVTGVASGATRAALTQHFACQKNAADISAKEGSQETAATLVGMLFGMLLARLTAGHTGAIWSAFLFLTAFHMYGEYHSWYMQNELQNLGILIKAIF